MMTRDEFWKLADGHRIAEQYIADERLRHLGEAPIDHVRSVLLQYRFFTMYYIGDLALLVYKVPFGKLRSALGAILSDELGNGDAAKAHPTLYDGFLRSIGVQEDDLDALAIGANIALLEELRALMLQGSAAYCIGLRGMGGECLCQIQLETMYRYVRRNPHLRALDELRGVDWYFWEIHAGEVDKEHQETIRACLDDVMIARPEAVREMADGYLKAKRSFDRFWDNAFSEGPEPAR